MVHPDRTYSVANDKAEVIAPIRFAFRSFDRQWIIPDARLINQPNPNLWKAASVSQVYLTALMVSFADKWSGPDYGGWAHP